MTTHSVGPNPFGIARLTGLANRQAYDITVSLTLPRSPPNLDRGNFMIALHLLTTPPGQPTAATRKSQHQLPQLPYLTPATTISSSRSSPPDHHLPPTHLDLPTYLTTHTILHTSTRPALIPYLDPLAATAARVLFLPLNLLLFSTTTTTHRSATSTVRLTVPMAEDLMLVPQYHADATTTTTATRLPESLLLEVQAGQDIQVYDARVTLVARLRGLRGFMYRWRATAFVLFTGGFWMVEMGVLVGVVVGVLVVLNGKAGWGVGVGEGDELDSDYEEENDGRRGGKGWKKGGDGEEGSSSSTSPPSGFDEGVVKKEEEEEEEGEEMAKVPVFEAEESDEADDEAEEGGGVKDVGTGTSFSGHRSKEGVRRRSGAGHGVRDSQ